MYQFLTPKLGGVNLSQVVNATGTFHKSSRLHRLQSNDVSVWTSATKAQLKLNNRRAHGWLRLGAQGVSVFRADLSGQIEHTRKVC